MSLEKTKQNMHRGLMVRGNMIPRIAQRKSFPFSHCYVNNVTCVTVGCVGNARCASKRLLRANDLFFKFA